MIQFESVSKVYSSVRGPIAALDNVSLTIEAGEFVALCGPSGCGKSTFLMLAGGLHRPTSGRVVVSGSDLGSLSYADRSTFRAEKIGFVFQMFHLLPYLSVLDNVLVASSNGRNAAEARARELIDACGLGERLLHRPAELSAGERQRVAIARALLNRPAVLLADEPTGNLDPENARGVLDLLGQFVSDGGAVVLATHDSHAAERADRIIRLQRGRLVEPSELAPSASQG